MVAAVVLAVVGVAIGASAGVFDDPRRYPDRDAGRLLDVLKGAGFDEVLSEWGLVLPCDIARQRDLRYHESDGVIGGRSLRIRFRITADCVPALLARLAPQRHRAGRGDDPDFPFAGGVGPHGWRFDPAVTYSWYVNDDTSHLRTVIIDQRTAPSTAYLSIWIE